MGYTDVFGGNTIYPADVSFLHVDLVEDIEFAWPLESAAPKWPLARIIDVMATAPVLPNPGWAMTLPDATEAAPGQVVLFNNLSGSQVCFIKDHSGATIATLGVGEQWELYLVDNLTPAGLWRIFNFGASTATVQPSALAGYGLTVTGATLSQSIPVNTFNAGPISLIDSSRAAAFVFTGTGSATINLPGVGAVGNNWFTSARNAGGGDLTVEPLGGETIDGAANLRLSPGEGVLIITDGLEWFTLGLGQPAIFAFDFTVIDLSASGPVYTLTGSELNRISYKFIGALTTNVTVIVPSTVQQYWVDNSTTGAFSLSLSTLGGTPVNIAQGARAIFYSDGTEIVDADTGGIPIPITVPAGGTGITSYTVGDMLYAAAPTVLAKLADVPVGNVLNAGGVGLPPFYGPVNLATSVIGVLPPANGGTGVVGAFVENVIVKGGPGGNLISSAGISEVAGNVGIGAVAAFGKLQVNSPDALSQLALVGTTSAVRGYSDATSYNFWALDQTLTNNKTMRLIGGEISLFIGGAGEAMRVLPNRYVAFNLGLNTPMASFYDGVTLAGVITASAVDGFAADSAKHRWRNLNGSAEWMRIGADGSVGIGTTVLAAKLNVAGAPGPGFEFHCSHSANTNLLLSYDRVGSVYSNLAFDGLGHVFRIAGAPVLTVASPGYVGIGIVNPQYPLEVVTSFGLRAASPVINFSNTTGGTRFGYINHDGLNLVQATEVVGGSLQFHTVGGERMRVAANGRVGIGITVPGAKLHIAEPDGGPYQLGFSGTSKGCRLYSNAAGTNIEGVDNTLSASFQPLNINGSQVNIQSLGVNYISQDGINTLLKGRSIFAPAASLGGIVWEHFDPAIATRRMYLLHDGASYSLQNEVVNGYANIAATGPTCAVSLNANGIRVVLASPDAVDIAVRAVRIGSATGVNAVPARVQFVGAGYSGAQSYQIGQGVDLAHNGGFSIKDMTNNTNRFNIDPIGNFGFNTSVPGYLIDARHPYGPSVRVYDETYAHSMMITTSASGGLVGTTSASNMYAMVGGTAAFIFLGNGFYPNSHNTANLGGAGNAWGTVYAANPAIQPSDQRLKTPLAPLTAAELAAAKTIAQGIGSYQWLDTAKLGDKVHIGVIAQAVIAAMEAQGLDALAYGFVQYNEWEAVEGVEGQAEVLAVIDEETREVLTEAAPFVAGFPGREAGNEYSVAYSELAMFIAAAQEQRLAALEALLP